MILTRDQTFQVVLSLRTQVSLGQESVGTGIFVEKADKLYLLTATHVALATSQATAVVISDARGNATSMSLADFNMSLAWKHHPVADISARDRDESQGSASLGQ